MWSTRNGGGPVKKWMRRIRGLLGTAVTWALAWSSVGAAIGLLNVVFAGAPIGAVVVTFALAWAKMGFVAGAIFSVVLGVVEGRRRFDEVSLPRFAAWGAVGALFLAIPIAMGLTLTIQTVVGFGTAVLLGVGSAAGSLALARTSDNAEFAGPDEETLGLTEALDESLYLPTVQDHR